MRNNDLDLEILKIAVKELKPLHSEIVFLGGATISLFITDPQHITIRETEDVDCVVEVSHRTEYEEIVKKLREIGFNEDADSKVICRFKKGSLLIDVMPTNPKILGFTNRWYVDGFKKAIELTVGDEKANVFDLPYLVASKIEAFKGRGQGEFRTSHDIEDLVTIFDGRRSISEDIRNSEKEIFNYLQSELASMRSNPKFVDSLEAHISDRENLAGRKKILLERIDQLLVEP